MTIDKTLRGDALTVALTGSLDSVTAPSLEKDLTVSLDGVTSLTIDCAGLKYVSSAGLRVLLAAHKRLSGQGGMTLTHVNETVMDVFEVTGFSTILNIE